LYGLSGSGRDSGPPPIDSAECHRLLGNDGASSKLHTAAFGFGKKATGPILACTVLRGDKLTRPVFSCSESILVIQLMPITMMSRNQFFQHLTSLFLSRRKLGTATNQKFYEHFWLRTIPSASAFITEIKSMTKHIMETALDYCLAQQNPRPIKPCIGGSKHICLVHSCAGTARQNSNPILLKSSISNVFRLTGGNNKLH